LAGGHEEGNNHVDQEIVSWLRARTLRRLGTKGFTQRVV